LTSEWRSLEFAPKDGTRVLFWVPEDDARPFDEGETVLGVFDEILGDYFDHTDALIKPICWRHVPNGPRNMDEIQWTPF
jgi:hypothetical protein